MSELKKVKPGDALDISAKSFNDFVDAAAYVKNQGALGGSIRKGTSSGIQKTADIVKVRNGGSETFNQFDVVGLREMLFDPSSDDTLPSWKLNPPTFDVGRPRCEDVAKFAVLLEPLVEDDVGLAVISGAVQVLVDIVDEADEFADITPGDRSKLTSVADGSAQILLKESSGEGEKLCLVRLSNAASSDVCVSTSTTTPPSTSSSSTTGTTGTGTTGTGTTGTGTTGTGTTGTSTTGTSTTGTSTTGTGTTGTGTTGTSTTGTGTTGTSTTGTGTTGTGTTGTGTTGTGTTGTGTTGTGTTGTGTTGTGTSTTGTGTTGTSTTGTGTTGTSTTGTGTTGTSTTGTGTTGTGTSTTGTGTTGTGTSTTGTVTGTTGTVTGTTGTVTGTTGTVTGTTGTVTGTEPPCPVFTCLGACSVSFEVVTDVRCVDGEIVVDKATLCLSSSEVDESSFSTTSSGS